MNTLEFRGIFSLFLNSLCASITELLFFHTEFNVLFLQFLFVQEVPVWSDVLSECKLSTLFWEALNTHSDAIGRNSNNGSMAADYSNK